jgi:peroxiredoxin
MNILKMKKTIILLMLLAVAVSCAKEPKYRITGTISGADSTMVVLQKRISGGYEALDSAYIENGVFDMEGTVDYPQLVVLAIKGQRGGLSFYVENSDIMIHGQADSLFTASVTGSKTQSEYDAYKASFDETNSEMSTLFDSYREARMSGDEEAAASIEQELNALDEKQTELKKEFIAGHPSSYVTPEVISEISYYLEADEMEAMLSSLDTTLNKVQSIRTMKDRLVKLKAVAVGQKAPDFTLNDVDGNPVSLYSKLGGNTKLLLVDFWAAWCPPCREENPNVVKIWKEYNKKGFDVLGVSLDRTREDWVKAIEDDKLTWTHVSDLKYWDTEPRILYAVSAIPSNFLIDGDGVIIGHNLRGEALAEKVKEVLGN